MDINNLILRSATLSPLTTKGSALTWAELDANFTTIYNEFLLQQLSGYIPTWDNITVYDANYINVAIHNGKLYQYINGSPAANQNPTANPTYWTERYAAYLAHRPDTDTILAGGTADEVSANEIRSFIDQVQPLVYKAILTQTGTSAPVETVLKNTLGEVPTYAYSGVGSYALNTVGVVFPVEAKVFIQVVSNTANTDIDSRWATTSQIAIETYAAGVLTNERLNKTTISIEVYP